ncbi:hypothetical protein DFH07DRAFT_97486 [Mycena maculata]|uniref:F-box domain-containing protein n=1 Tax=Mycena maculata TaxID=230809 RepID=A0AAD7MXN3_9AGAR|nr:hypothetical protein DFH07DRAFT_97486 [Mycena maculata]
MHRCLKIPELIHMICRCLFELSALATLAALARVHKDFENPALDALWAEQSTLINLVRCMPPDICRNAMRNRACGPVLSRDLDRLLKYSARIRIYKMYEPSKNSVGGGAWKSGELFRILHSAVPQASLFPNLKTLQWAEWFPDETSRRWIPFFLGEKLTNITLHVTPSDQVLTLLSRIRTHCPLIQDASLDFESLSSLLPVQVEESIIRSCVSYAAAVSGWSRLSHLSVSTMDATAWLHLSRAGTLKVSNILRLQDADGRTLQSGLEPYPKGFSSLCELRVHRASLDACGQLIKRFARSPIETLVIIVEFSSSNHSWPTFLERIFASRVEKNTYIRCFPDAHTWTTNPQSHNETSFIFPQSHGHLDPVPFQH